MMGLTPAFFALAVEVEHAVHVAVVGHGHGRLAVSRRRGRELAYTRRSVEHRELGVHMKMGKRTSHGPLLDQLTNGVTQL